AFFAPEMVTLPDRGEPPSIIYLTKFKSLFGKSISGFGLLSKDKTCQPRAATIGSVSHNGKIVKKK
ncbi:MAG: hypothetical protein MRZ24_07515, partial [Clostridiales bacterium]|nr:hypothetical protein [Clostridiales bacterium]